MTETDKAAFAQAFNRLGLALREKDPDAMTLRTYFDGLRDLEIEFITAAADSLARRAEYGFPKLPDWTREARRIESERDAAQRARLRRLREPLCSDCGDTRVRYLEGGAAPCPNRRRRGDAGDSGRRGTDRQPQEETQRRNRMTETMSSTTRKTAVVAQIASIGDAGGTLDAVVVNGRVYSGPAALSRAVENFTTRELDELQPQLDREEDRLAERARLDHEREARAAEYDAPNVYEGIDRERAEAAAAAATYASSNGAKLDRIEAVLERIATAIEKR